MVEIDHGWCTSIYTNDPNGIAVEFCTTTSTFSEQDRTEAMAILDGEPSRRSRRRPTRSSILAKEYAAAKR